MSDFYFVSGRSVVECSEAELLGKYRHLLTRSTRVRAKGADEWATAADAFPELALSAEKSTQSGPTPCDKPSNGKRYYLLSGTHQASGPFRLEDLRDKYSRLLSPSAIVCPEDSNVWSPVKEILPGLSIPHPSSCRAAKPSGQWQPAQDRTGKPEGAQRPEWQVEKPAESCRKTAVDEPQDALARVYKMYAVCITGFFAILLLCVLFGSSNVSDREVGLMLVGVGYITLLFLVPEALAIVVTKFVRACAMAIRFVYRVVLRVARRTPPDNTAITP